MSGAPGRVVTLSGLAGGFSAAPGRRPGRPSARRYQQRISLTERSEASAGGANGFQTSDLLDVTGLTDTALAVANRGAPDEA